MRKSGVLIILSMLSLPLFAAVPIQPFESSPYFRSPARLADAEESTPFSIDVRAGGDIIGMRFLADPASALGSGADYLASSLASQSDEYLLGKYDELKKIFSFDGNFPGPGNTDAETAYYIRKYFSEGGGFEGAGESNRALAVASLLSSDPSLFRGERTGSDLDLSLRFHGGRIRNGFGWAWRVEAGFDGSEYLLDQHSYGDHVYGNDISVMAGADLGYGRYAGDRLAIGFSITPRLIFHTSFLSSSYLSARLGSDLISLLSSNTYDMGFGIGFNAGAMYRLSDELSFTLDFRDVPSFRTYWYFSTEDIVGDFTLHHDRNLYLTPPDAAIGMRWDHGRLHVSAELSDAVSQLVWASVVSGYSYDPWIIPKAAVRYDLSEESFIKASIEYRTLMIGIGCHGFGIELSSRLDRPDFGIRMNYTV